MMRVLSVNIFLSLLLIVVAEDAKAGSTSSLQGQQFSSALPAPPPQQPASIEIVEFDHNRKDDSIASFLADLEKLDALRHTIPILSVSHSSTDSTYTRSWTSVDWERHQVRSFFRYRRHLVSWVRSPTARAVIPSVAVAIVWTIIVKVLHLKIDKLREVVFAKSSFSSGVSAFTAPIGLLLALRTNRSLNRLLEARNMFGKMIRSTASLAGMGCTYLPEADAILMGRYLSMYGWAIKGTFRKEDHSQVCQIMLPNSEMAWISSTKADTPTSIIFRLRQLIAKSKTQIPTAAASAMERYLSELESALGICKRLIASPTPPTFSRHTSRVLCLYLGLLPVALVATTSNLASVLVSVTLLSYVFIGIDEISVEIENPFPLIPMFQLACNLQTNIQNQLDMMGSVKMVTP